MRLKAAVNVQFFERPEFDVGKKFLRSMFLVMGATLIFAASARDAALVLGVAGFALSASAALFVVGQTRASSQGAQIFWRTNAFSFFLMGGMLVPAGLWTEHLLSLVTIAAVAGLSLIAGILGFCLGRLVFVLLFVPPKVE